MEFSATSAAANAKPCTCGGDWEDVVAESIKDTPIIGTKVLIVFHRVNLITATM